MRDISSTARSVRSRSCWLAGGPACRYARTVGAFPSARRCKAAGLIANSSDPMRSAILRLHQRAFRRRRSPPPQQWQRQCWQAQRWRHQCRQCRQGNRPAECGRQRRNGGYCGHGAAHGAAQSAYQCTAVPSAMPRSASSRRSSGVAGAAAACMSGRSTGRGRYSGAGAACSGALSGFQPSAWLVSQCAAMTAGRRPLRHRFPCPCRH